MKRSSDLLRFLALEKKLQRQHLEIVWSAGRAAMRKGDAPLVGIVVKVMMHASSRSQAL
jgi:hypothetical protein